MRDIGQRLGVGSAVEGSVRKSGTRLRITAQLVSTRDGSHLWSEVYERDLADVFAVQEEIARALALDPRLPVTYRWYGQYLLVMGRTREMVDVRLRGLALDPLSATLAYNVVSAHIVVREFDAAIAEARKAIALHPNSPLAHESLGWAFVDAGRPAEAIAPFERAMALGGRWWPLANLGRAYAMAGRPADARRVLDRLVREWGDRAPGGMAISAVYLALGKRDSAFVWLERDFQQRGEKLPFIHVFEAWAPLRGDPRFTRLITGMGLDSALAGTPR